MKNKSYLIYKITNNINGKIYIGAHETYNENDSYMGSGDLIKAAIKKYGLENFTKEILSEHNNIDEMYLAEESMVDEDFVLRKDTYNIRIGGRGGFKHLTGTCWVLDSNGNGIRTDKNDPRIISGELRGVNSGKVLVKDINGNTLLTSIDDHRIKTGEFNYMMSGVEHKQSTIDKMKETHKNTKKSQGSKNSQFGTCWIKNETLKKNKSINKDDLNQWTSNGWIRGRKIGWDSLK